MKWRVALEQVKQMRDLQTTIEIAEQLIHQSDDAERFEYLHQVSKPIEAHIWLRLAYEDDVESEVQDVEIFQLD